MLRTAVTDIFESQIASPDGGGQDFYTMQATRATLISTWQTCVPRFSNIPMLHGWIFDLDDEKISRNCSKSNIGVDIVYAKIKAV